MKLHTMLTKAASLAVCFGVLLSGPVMAGAESMIRDVEISKDGTLYGVVHNAQGQAVAAAPVQLKYHGKAVAATSSNADGRFAITGVRGGAHELMVGSSSSPVRLWANGTAPKTATQGIAVAANEAVVRGQSYETYPGATGPSGFGMLDVITVATVGAAAGALVFAIDNNNKLDDIETRLLASP